MHLRLLLLRLLFPRPLQLQLRLWHSLLSPGQCLLLLRCLLLLLLRCLMRCLLRCLLLLLLRQRQLGPPLQQRLRLQQGAAVQLRSSAAAL
jgi:hypothetical protein